MHKIKLWIKISYSLMVALIVPIYWHEYGPANFLWFSDIAMILMVPALWLENRLITSMMAVSVLLLEVLWVIDFCTKGHLTGLTNYMFDPSLPLFLRGLSFFHIPMPLVIIYMLLKLGYDKRAIYYQIILMLFVLPITYVVADPYKDNINWVFGLGEKPQHWINPYVYLILLIVGYLIVYFISHLIFKKIFTYSTLSSEHKK